MPSNALLTILTEANALSVLLATISIMGSGLVVVAGWLIPRLIKNLDSLNESVQENNVYQKQHNIILRNHEDRLVRLEYNKNGKS